MSVDRATVVTRFWQDFWNKGDASLAEELMAADMTARDPAFPDFQPGWHNYREQLYTPYRTAFPDVIFEVREQYATGPDRVVCAWTATGTNHGPLNGQPPTGRRIAIDGMSLFTVMDGRITHHTAVWDRMGMATQLGWLD